jgi:hypothetical protein
LNADIEWQGGHPDGTSSVPPAIAEYFDKKVQTAVDDLWMIGKIWCAFTIPNTRPTRKTLSRLPTEEDGHSAESCAIYVYARRHGLARLRATDHELAHRPLHAVEMRKEVQSCQRL